MAAWRGQRIVPLFPTPVYIPGMLSDSGSDKGETSADKEGDARFDPDGFGDDKAGNTGSDLDGAELTKLPVRGWEYWEKEASYNVKS